MKRTSCPAQEVARRIDERLAVHQPDIITCFNLNSGLPADHNREPAAVRFVFLKGNGHSIHARIVESRHRSTPALPRSQFETLSGEDEHPMAVTEHGSIAGKVTELSIG